MLKPVSLSNLELCDTGEHTWSQKPFQFICQITSKYDKQRGETNM